MDLRIPFVVGGVVVVAGEGTGGGGDDDAILDSLIRFSSRSLYRSPKRLKCGVMTSVYLTNSSMQSTNRSLLPLGFNLLPPSAAASSSVNCV